MLSEKMINALNEQIAFEGYASFLYLAQAGWFENKSMQGCASFMYRQSKEEHVHMMKIFHYLLEMDAMAISPAIKQPPSDFTDVRTVFADTLAHEQRVTKSINDIVELAIRESDHATYAFLQWYVTEQREEESLMRTILDKINLIGDGAQSLYFIDKEIEAINQTQIAAEKAEGGEA
jgi:ferritin